MKKTAYWIQRSHLSRQDEYECSACGFFADKPYRTCPHCQRMMKGLRYDPSCVDYIETLDAIFDNDKKNR